MDIEEYRYQADGGEPENQMQESYLAFLGPDPVRNQILANVAEDAREAGESQPV